MKAIRLHNYGSSDDLRYEDVSLPQITDTQVLVKVYATSVNHLDTLKASGALSSKFQLNFPWIPGHDFAGIIESVGANVTGLRAGDEVYGNCIGGSYAEYVAADMTKVVKKPANISFVKAASVPHVAETAWQALHTHGNVKPCQKVLIHGAAGAVGAYAVQFAHAANAFVYATASAGDKDFLESIKADVVIDYKTQDFTKIAEDVDLVLDFVGGETQKRSYSVMKKGGRLVTTVGPVFEEEAKKSFVIGISMVIEQSAQDLEIITRMISEGEVTCDVASVYPLKDTRLAWDSFLNKDVSQRSTPHGKIVLEVVDDPNREDIYGNDKKAKNPLEKSAVTTKPLRSEWSEGK